MGGKDENKTPDTTPSKKSQADQTPDPDSEYTESGTWNIPDYEQMQSEGGPPPPPAAPEPPAGFAQQFPVGPGEMNKSSSSPDEKDDEPLTESGTWNISPAAQEDPSEKRARQEAENESTETKDAPSSLRSTGPQQALELPKPKSFGGYKSIKQTQQASRVQPGTRGPSGRGKSSEIFTVIGNNDDTSISDSARAAQQNAEPSPGRYDSSVMGSSRQDVVKTKPQPAQKRRPPGARPRPPSGRSSGQRPAQPNPQTKDADPSRRESASPAQQEQEANYTSDGWGFAEAAPEVSDTHQSVHDSAYPSLDLNADPVTDTSQEIGYENFQDDDSDSGFSSGSAQNQEADLSQADNYSYNTEGSEPSEYGAGVFDQSGDESASGYDNDYSNTGYADSGYEKALKDASSTVATADSSMENKNYKVALPLYTKALQIYREEETTQTPEFAHCIERYGDCHFHKGNFEEALNAYREHDALFSRTEMIPDQVKVIALLKLGKTSYRMKRFADSEASYELAINIANSTLPVEHPMIPILYQSYMSMLKARGADKYKIEKLEKDYDTKVKQGASEENVPEDLREELSAWIEPEPGDLASIIRYRQATTDTSHKRDLRSTMEASGTLTRVAHSVNPIVILAAVALSATLVLVGAFLFLGTKGLDTFMSAEGNTSELAPLRGSVFVSADGLKSAEINKDNTITLTYGSQKATIEAISGEPETGPIANLKKVMLGKTSCAFTQVTEGMLDPDGTMLYKESARDHKVIEEMKHVMKLANYYYSRNNQYPRKRQDLLDLGSDITLVNPLGNNLKPRFEVFEFEKYEGDVAFTQKLKDYESGKNIFSIDGTDQVEPGLIECLSILPYDYYHKEDGISFMVRAYGTNKKFISSSQPKSAFVLAEKNGLTYKAIKEETVHLPLKDQAKTTAYIKLKKK